MPIQPGLALQLKGVELPDPMALQAQSLQIQNALQQQRMGEMQIQNALREQQRKQRFESTVAGFQPGMSINERVQALQRQGLTNEAMQFAKTEHELEKQRSDAETARLTKIKTVAELTGRFLTGVQDDPSTYPAVRQQIIARGLATDDELPKQYDKAFVDRVLKGSLSVKDQAEIDLRSREAGARVMSAEAARSQAETAAAKLPFDELRAKAAERAAAAAEARTGQEKLTPAEREYQNAKERGEFSGSFVDWKKMVQPRMFESSTDTERTKLLADRVKKVDAAGESASKLLPSIDVSMSILDKGFDTNWGTSAKKEAARVLAAFGVAKADEYATNATLFLSEARKVLLERLLAQKGTQSENDAKRIEESFVSLGNTTAANKFMLNFAKAQAKNEIAKQNFYEKWFRDNKTYEGAEVAWNEGPGSKSIFDAPEMKDYASLASKATPPPAGPVVGGRSATPRGRPSITERPQTPSAGDVMDGYRFKGGNPADENNWEKVGG